MIHKFELLIDIPSANGEQYIDHIKQLLFNEIERIGQIGRIKGVIYVRPDRLFEKGCEALEREYWEHGEIDL